MSNFTNTPLYKIFISIPNRLDKTSGFQSVLSGYQFFICLKLKVDVFNRKCIYSVFFNSRNLSVDKVCNSKNNAWDCFFLSKIGTKSFEFWSHFSVPRRFILFVLVYFLVPRRFILFIYFF
jgi:hypothetical protein